MRYISYILMKSIGTKYSSFNTFLFSNKSNTSIIKYIPTIFIKMIRLIIFNSVNMISKFRTVKNVLLCVRKCLIRTVSTLTYINIIFTSIFLFFCTTFLVIIILLYHCVPNQSIGRNDCTVREIVIK